MVRANMIYTRRSTQPVSIGRVHSRNVTTKPPTIIIVITLIFAPISLSTRRQPSTSQATQGSTDKNSFSLGWIPAWKGVFSKWLANDFCFDAWPCFWWMSRRRTQTYMSFWSVIKGISWLTKEGIMICCPCLLCALWLISKKSGNETWKGLWQNWIIDSKEAGLGTNLYWHILYSTQKYSYSPKNVTLNSGWQGQTVRMISWVSQEPPICHRPKALQGTDKGVFDLGGWGHTQTQTVYRPRGIMSDW